MQIRLSVVRVCRQVGVQHNFANVERFGSVDLSGVDAVCTCQLLLQSEHDVHVRERTVAGAKCRWRVQELANGFQLDGFLFLVDARA